MTSKQDPREKAEKYMEKHKILKLFEELGTAVIYERPADPNAFLIEELKKKTAKKTAHFFSEQDVKTMFSMFDTTQKGHISKDQYAQALRSLGIDKPSTLPLPSKTQKVDKHTFVKNAMKELKLDKAV